MHNYLICNYSTTLEIIYLILLMGKTKNTGFLFAPQLCKITIHCGRKYLYKNFFQKESHPTLILFSLSSSLLSAKASFFARSSLSARCLSADSFFSFCKTVFFLYSSSSVSFSRLSVARSLSWDFRRRSLNILISLLCRARSWEISFSVSSNLFKAFSCLCWSLFSALFSFCSSSSLMWSSVSSFRSSLIFSSLAERTLFVTRSISFAGESLVRLWERKPHRVPLLLGAYLASNFFVAERGKIKSMFTIRQCSLSIQTSLEPSSAWNNHTISSRDGSFQTRQ